MPHFAQLTAAAQNRRLRHLRIGSLVLAVSMCGISRSGFAATKAAVAATSAAISATTTAIASTGGAGNYTLTGKVTVSRAPAPTGGVSFIDQSDSNFTLGSAMLDAATLTNDWLTFTTSAAASANYGVVIGDLNGDGIPDVVISNYGGATISVFLGNGDGTFPAHVDYPAGTLPFGMALGDLNGDGIPDIAVASHNSSAVNVLLGNGDGTFQASQSYATAGISQYVAIADFNGDGILDLVTCTSGAGSLSVLLGNGNGTFQAQHAFGTNSSTYGLAVADFNHDGLPDVVVSNNTRNTVSVFLGNGDGTFQAQSNYAAGTNPTTIAVGDLNADGNPDLVVGNFGGSAISVLLGNADGTFQAKTDYAGSSSPWGVAVADVNGDGILDVVATSPSSEAIEFFQGKGDGTLLAPVTTITGSASYLIALGDLNGDGVVDLIAPNLAVANIRVSLGSLSATASLAGVSVPGGGLHNVVASYAGDGHFSSSTSTAINLAGTMIPTAVALSAVPALGAPGQTFLLTATVAPASSSGYTAGGTVSFFDGGVAIGSAVTVANGSAALSKSDFAIGAHNIAATYSGDVNFNGSNTASPTVLTVAQAPDYSIAANPAALTIKRGWTGTSVLTITPVGRFSGQVLFTCSGLPQFSTCSFSPAVVTLPGDDVTHAVQFSLNTGGTVTAMGTPQFGSRGGGLSSFGMFSLCVFSLGSSVSFYILALVPVTRRRNHTTGFILRRGVQMLFVTAVLVGIVGCGGSSRNQAPLGTSTVTMTATTVGGSIQHSVVIVITITP